MTFVTKIKSFFMEQIYQLNSHLNAEGKTSNRWKHNFQNERQTL